MTLSHKSWPVLAALPAPRPLATISDELLAITAREPTSAAAAIAAIGGCLRRYAPEVFTIVRLAGETWTPLVPSGVADSPAVTALSVRTDRPSAHRVARAGDIAIVTAWFDDAPPLIDAQLLRHVARWLSMTIALENAAARVVFADDEATVLRLVASEILTIRDLDQVLLSIATQTLGLLDADICGVLLREGDRVQMRSCVGHRMVETAHLRMKRGQGVAGLVFQTGEIGRVDSYLTDRTISGDFLSLAAQEATRSALAVPLRSHGEFIGVLEVWRRRDSIFTDADVRRMVSLADLATIAIENASLYEDQRVMVDKLREAHDAMEHQVELLRRSSRLQNSLLRLILEGSGAYGGIVKTVSRELGCTVAYSTADGQLDCCEPADAHLAEIQSSVAELSRTHHRAVHTATRRMLPSGRRWWTHAVFVAEIEIGMVSLIGGTEADEAMEVAAGQAAMACSLAHLEQRAASQARNAAFDQIVWDLMEGPVEHRTAALGRAGEMGIQLSGPHRVIHGSFANLTELAREREWDTATVDRSKRSVIRALKSSSAGHAVRMLSLRGDWIVAVVEVNGRADARGLMSTLTTAARESVPGVELHWGMSSCYDKPLNYPAAFREAQTALSGARRLRTGTFSLYDELGIVRLLLGPTGESADLQRFIDEVTAPLTAYDRQHDGSLLITLRAFFDSDCSQKRAAEMLFVHPKTLRYRLDQIAQLSGLDLSVHADRMRADLALRLLEVSANNVQS
ncbi:GAF domain-containing protein [Cryobacterium frigoriphilum]|uniref:GAF domain-containing protein n=1 Tax=Cryobacterium frigoriphilum TaxID=1259150 RepID=A0A4R8ZZQ6_9MICO|nr:helix-turn-helix domain-containing protein [Cryobacterium frigoriphilum]TFD49635.1 GAF domain-containing protein [Cryobacterium frigoriphilum]